MQGSPPQVRGKLENPSLRRGTVRITPAGAGKTKNEKVFHVLKQDHPRRCGENAAKNIAGTQRLGSPPQVRGKLGQCGCCVADAGITPAGAGKTPVADARAV